MKCIAWWLLVHCSIRAVWHETTLACFLVFGFKISHITAARGWHRCVTYAMSKVTVICALIAARWCITSCAPRDEWLCAQLRLILMVFEQLHYIQLLLLLYGWLQVFYLVFSLHSYQNCTLAKYMDKYKVRPDCASFILVSLFNILRISKRIN